MNIMLVEDEPPILRELEHLITEFGEPFHIIATATNGQAAKELVDKNYSKIDYILTDIQIPVITGLELVEYVKENYPSIICSFLTGFNDFAYIQKALRMKVLDYILKPIDKKVLLKQLKEAYEQKCLLSASKAESYSPLITNRSDEDSYITSYRQILINIGQFSYKNDLSLNVEPSNDYFSMLKHALENFSKDYQKSWIIQDKNDHTFFFLFSFDENQLRVANSFYQKLYFYCCNIFPNVTMVSNSTTITIQNIKENIQYQRRYLKDHILFAHSSNYRMEDHYEDVTFTINPEHFPTESISRISSLFSKFKLEMFHTELHNLINTLHQQTITQKELSQILLTLFTESTFSFFNFDTVSKLDFHIIVDDVILLATSYESLYDNLVSIFDEILSTIMNETKTVADSKNVFLLIDDYIKKHYTESINTKDLADEFGFTPAYLSKLFRDYKKVTPAEYISSLRITKAKLLLESNSSLSIKDVALATGYSDPLYFSKVFKKNVGFTPKSFQEQHQTFKLV